MTNHYDSWFMRCVCICDRLRLLVVGSIGCMGRRLEGEDDGGPWLPLLGKLSAGQR